MKILLSPAKALDLKKTINFSSFTSPFFIKKASLLIDKLKEYSPAQISNMMNISTNLGELNYQRYHNWKSDVNKNNNNNSAIAAFNGEVYKSFDSKSLTSEQHIFTQEKIRILSGLYGVLKPLDIIYPYRLEMGTKLSYNLSTKNLYQFWGSSITDFLNKEESEIIINLASTEYFKAIDKKTLNSRIITPIFKEFKNGDYKVVMIFAKRARGLMARYIIDKNILDPEDIKLFDIEGYSFDIKMSNEENWVFTR